MNDLNIIKINGGICFRLIPLIDDIDDSEYLRVTVTPKVARYIEQKLIEEPQPDDDERDI